LSRYYEQSHNPMANGWRCNRAARMPGRIGRGLLLPALVWTMALLGGARPLWAQPDDSSDLNREYAIKAAYLYQFGRYVQWPAQSFAGVDSPLVIGILGPDPFGGILEEIARTKRVEGRPIVVRHFASLAEYTACHILFIAAPVSPEQEAVVIQKLHGTPVLLVGESPKFAERGGTVNFFQEENRIRFEINPEVAKQDQLKISSKLLSLAKIVGRY
jgi:hypothetical protein